MLSNINENSFKFIPEETKRQEINSLLHLVIDVKLKKSLTISLKKIINKFKVRIYLNQHKN